MYDEASVRRRASSKTGFRAGVAATMFGVLLLSGCGSDGSSAADDRPASPTESTSPSASATPTPSASPEEGRYGVTFEVRRAKSVPDSPAIETYQRALEAFGGSVNTRSIVSDMDVYFSKPLQRALADRVRIAWTNDLHVADRGIARVISSERAGKRVDLVVCGWTPSTDFLDAQDKLWRSDGPAKWAKADIRVERLAKGWVITDIGGGGTCKGGAPA